MSPSPTTDLLAWLTTNGTFLHPSLEVKQDPTFGLSTWTSSSLPAETTVISLPFELAVTPELAEEAILSLLAPVGGEEEIKKLEERVKVLVYLMLHWIGDDEGEQIESSSPLLKHHLYLRSLPPASSLLTPLYFSPAERELLKGTSVLGAANEMETTWRADHERVGKVLGLGVEKGFTWDRYLLASTYLSSRAFPSRLLVLPSSNSSAPSPASTASHPVLLPGIDILNHLPLHPVSWISSPSRPSSSSASNPSQAVISILLPSPTPVGSQIFNNYGGKPNDELLLAYGFTLPSLPFDTCPLLLSSSTIPPQTLAELKELGLDVGKRFLVGRDGVISGEGELRVAVRWLMGDEKERATMRQWAASEPNLNTTEEVTGGEESRKRAWWSQEAGGENEMNVVELLGEMVGLRLRALRAGGESEGEVREEVRKMVRVYRTGQIEILDAAKVWLDAERGRVAERYGFDLEEEEEEEGEEEEDE